MGREQWRSRRSSCEDIYSAPTRSVRSWLSGQGRSEVAEQQPDRAKHQQTEKRKYFAVFLCEVRLYVSQTREGCGKKSLVSVVKRS